MNTARTVAALLREQDIYSGNQTRDDVSTITQPIPANVSATDSGQQSMQATPTTTPVVNNISYMMNRRSIGAYHTINSYDKVVRQVQAARTNQNEREIRHCRAELDTHADTYGVNNTANILEYLGKVAEVSGFSSSVGVLKEVPIVKAAVAYDHPTTGETVILIINQALYFDDNIEHLLLNPNQMKANGVEVDNIPMHLSAGKSTHSILFPEAKYRIPLNLHGVISYFNIRTPTLQEINTCETLTLTSQGIEWQPYSPEVHEQELQYKSEFKGISILPISHESYSDNIMRQLNKLTTKESSLEVNEATLAKRWGIPSKVAQNTIRATTQNFIRSTLHLIERRFRTKNTTLRYNHLNCRFYSNTFFVQKPSLLQNTCAQLLVSDFGYLIFCPQKRKSEAPYSLQELIQDVGIPSHIHTDGAKEMTVGDWQRICQEAGIKMSHTEKQSPWENRTEVEICGLKHHAR
jgi:hypothetical protein